MKTEKIHLEKKEYTIQPRRRVHSNGKLGFVDNRPSVQRIGNYVIQCGGTETDFSRALGKEGKKEHEILVYGTESAREARRKDLKLPSGFKRKEEHSPVGPATSGFYTADKYNNYSWRDFEWEGKSSFSIFNPLYVEYNKKQNKTADQIKQDLMDWTRRLSLDKEDKREVCKYQEELLNHQSYSPLVTYQESDGFIGHRTSYNNFAKGKFELQTRRACKFGLEYMDKKGGEIAFLTSIDGISTPGNDYDILNKVKTANRAGGRQSSPRVPITTSEMRKAFRMNSGSVKFYDHEGGILFEPWETHNSTSKGIVGENKTWKDYSDQRYSKYLVMAYNLGIGRECREMKSADEIKDSVINELGLQYGEKLSPSELIYQWEQSH